MYYLRFIINKLKCELSFRDCFSFIIINKISIKTFNLNEFINT